MIFPACWLTNSQRSLTTRPTFEGFTAAVFAHMAFQVLFLGAPVPTTLQHISLSVCCSYRLCKQGRSSTGNKRMPVCHPATLTHRMFAQEGSFPSVGTLMSQHV